ncbi:hypothetical protein L596_002070 [Steinernema carpocapsae]|uniref:Uncharacterized protein n=1 Tax=Steinernema carpocapsae TaxID=34508 RepID=A0A4U8US20_STECR|nr:hypothetical protein L596_002070 [Steinernema carpocapsae]
MYVSFSHRSKPLPFCLSSSLLNLFLIYELVYQKRREQQKMPNYKAMAASDMLQRDNFPRSQPSLRYNKYTLILSLLHSSEVHSTTIQGVIPDSIA